MVPATADRQRKSSATKFAASALAFLIVEGPLTSRARGYEPHHEHGSVTRRRAADGLGWGVAGEVLWKIGDDDTPRRVTNRQRIREIDEPPHRRFVIDERGEEEQARGPHGMNGGSHTGRAAGVDDRSIVEWMVGVDAGVRDVHEPARGLLVEPEGLL